MASDISNLREGNDSMHNSLILPTIPVNSKFTSVEYEVL